MKKDSSANYEWTTSAHRDNLNPYVCKGEVGGWKDYITAEQAAILDSNYEKRLRQLALNLKFRSINSYCNSCKHILTLIKLIASCKSCFPRYD